VLPELFDEATDTAQRSFHSVICGAELGTVRFRGSGYYVPLHPSWCPKYVIQYLGFFAFPHLILINIYFLFWCRLRAAGLLPLVRLVEGGLMRATLSPAERRPRFGFDNKLVCALLDRWRPKTHSFHSCGGRCGDFGGCGPPLRATVLRGVHGGC
jgi:hypothetical protein